MYVMFPVDFSVISLSLTDPGPLKNKKVEEGTACFAAFF